MIYSPDNTTNIYPQTSSVQAQIASAISKTVLNSQYGALIQEENKSNWVLIDRAEFGGLSNKEIIKILKSARPELFI